MAVPEAKGEIIIFFDANSIYDKSSLLKLVRNFSEPAVGYVAGKMIYTNQVLNLVAEQIKQNLEPIIAALEKKVLSKNPSKPKQSDGVLKFKSFE